MVLVYLVYGYPDFVSFFISAWASLIIGGLLVVIFEDSNFFSKKNSSLDNKKWLEGLKYFEKGLEQYQKKNFKLALNCFDKAIECEYEEEVYGLRGDCFQEFEEHGKAINDYNKAIIVKFHKVVYETLYNLVVLN